MSVVLWCLTYRCSTALWLRRRVLSNWPVILTKYRHILQHCLHKCVGRSFADNIECQTSVRWSTLKLFDISPATPGHSLWKLSWIPINSSLELVRVARREQFRKLLFDKGEIKVCVKHFEKMLDIGWKTNNVSFIQYCVFIQPCWECFVRR